MKMTRTASIVWDGTLTNLELAQAHVHIVGVDHRFQDPLITALTALKDDTVSVLLEGYTAEEPTGQAHVYGLEERAPKESQGFFLAAFFMARRQAGAKQQEYDDYKDRILSARDRFIDHTQRKDSPLIARMGKEKGSGVLIAEAIMSLDTTATGGTPTWVEVLLKATFADVTNAVEDGLFNVEEHENILDNLKKFSNNAQPFHSFAAKQKNPFTTQYFEATNDAREAGMVRNILLRRSEHEDRAVIVCVGAEHAEPLRKRLDAAKVPCTVFAGDGDAGIQSFISDTSRT